LFLKSVNLTSGAQFGILDTIAKVVENPLFRGVVKNIVNQVFIQRGIPAVASIPGSAQKDVLDTIGAIITNPAFAKAIQDINTEFPLPIPPPASQLDYSDRNSGTMAIPSMLTFRVYLYLAIDSCTVNSPGFSLTFG
jgi:hypothetical protein